MGHVEIASARYETAQADELIYAFRRNVVVAASAGTGKTHRLTALYVLLSLGLTSMGQEHAGETAPAVPPERIVATTFSRAAAREIGDRVERSLRAIAAWDGAPDLPFLDVLAARGAAVGRELAPAELRARAAEALGRFRLARIDTLHGVAGQVALGHALALGLPPRARVLDEEEAEALADAAIDEALGAALSGDPAHAEAARALVSACNGVAFARMAVARLLDRLDEEGIGPRDLALADHAGAARALGRELVRVTREVASAGSDPFRSAAAELRAALGPYAFGAEGPFPTSATRAAIELFGARAPAKKKRTTADDELAAFRDLLPGRTNPDRGVHLAAWLAEAPHLAARERALVDLLDDIRERLRAARRRAGALSFGDLLRSARDGLRDVPEVSAAVRASLDVLLVDEFQDSSRIQRDLVYLLRERDDAAEARARGECPGAASIVGHGLFLVGDRKQSIYGFRGADVAVFARFCVDLAGEAAARALGIPRPAGASDEGVTADFVALRESRRSGEAVLAFVNAFSARDFAANRGAEPRDFEVAYGHAEHLAPFGPPPGETPRPRGDVVFVRDDGRAPEGAPPLVTSAAGAGREGFVAAAVVARELREGRAACRDVAVLARRRSTLPLVELGLARLGVPYVVAGRALFDAREIRDVAALLKLLLDPRDRLALATVLRGPVVGLSDAALASLSESGVGLTVPLVRPRGGARAEADETRLTALDEGDRARLEAFRDRFEPLRRAALRITPGEAIRAAIEGFDLDQIVAALPRPEARLGNVDRLAGLARRRGGSLASFVRWLERRIADEADEAEAAVFSPEDDAVRLTTIHASKGLDFPVVILVDLAAEPRGSNLQVSFAPGPAGEPTLAFRHVAKSPAGAGDPARPWALAEPIVVTTAALRDARAEARQRELAERSRLTYVAITRARRKLVLVGTAAKPRAGSAFWTLQEGLADPGFAATLTELDDAAALLEAAELHGAAAPARAATHDLPAPPRLPDHAPARTIALATTPLGLFRGCARRFRFRYLLGLDEPVASGQLALFAEGEPECPPPPDDVDETTDPRALGRAAHRVLERWPLELWGKEPAIADIEKLLEHEGLAPEGAEASRIAEGVARFLAGPYAASLRRDEARVAREEELVLLVPSTEGPTLALRGAMDLCVVRPSGLADVIDYKRSYPRKDLAPYEFQLRAYALAVRRRLPSCRVRAGVVFLGARDEPVFLPGDGEAGAIADAEHERFEGELADLGHRFAEARHTGRWDGVPIARCRALHCGFVGVCHGRERRQP
jgi:ATP-dependent helicase/nuclease subunit A